MKTLQEQLDFMISLASQKHFGTFDKGGFPYILHPLRIMQKVQTLYGDDFELMMMAIGHDLLEDTDVTADFLLANDISQRTVNGLMSLTHGKESYKDYIINIIKNPDAVKIKILDLDDNSQLNRLKGLTEKDFKRAAKYHTCYAFLTGKITVQDFLSSENV